MTTYSTIANASVAVGAIPSSSLMTAMRDNPIAMAEGSAGAPVVATGWHPVDKVTVGDAKTGLIYDSAVNGTVADVVTPDFTDGFEYRLLIENLSHNDGANNRGLTVELYRQTSATYFAVINESGVSSGTTVNAFVDIMMPRITKALSWVNYSTRSGTGVTPMQTSIDTLSPAQKILRARVRFTSSSIDAGKIWLFRRLEYVTTG